MIGYDSDNIDDIPLSAELLLYYADGEPGTATPLQLQRFSTITIKQSITRNLNSPAYWGDVEPGCLWPINQAIAAWQQKLVKGFYIDASNWTTLRDAIAAAQLQPPPYWVAEYPSGPLLVNPAVPQSWIDLGCVMWQYIDPPQSGGHFDLSVTVPGFPVPIPIQPFEGLKIMSVAFNPTTGLRTIEGSDVFDDTIVVTETAPNVWAFQNVSAFLRGDPAPVGTSPTAPKLYARPTAAAPPDPT
jgi:hypothetical protein